MTATVEPAIYRFSALTIDGHELPLARFQGNVLLIVNTASQCVYTRQYKALEALYQTYKERGFSLLGFPCDQFGHQEPGSEAEIASFCERNYGVTFPLFAKIDVNGPTAHPLFTWLRHQRPGLFGSDKIKWNFTKFLIDREGQVVSRFSPATNPSRLARKIEKLL